MRCSCGAAGVGGRCSSYCDTVTGRDSFSSAPSTAPARFLPLVSWECYDGLFFLEPPSPDFELRRAPTRDVEWWSAKVAPQTERDADVAFEALMCTSALAPVLETSSWGDANRDYVLDYEGVLGYYRRYTSFGLPYFTAADAGEDEDDVVRARYKALGIVTG